MSQTPHVQQQKFQGKRLEVGCVMLLPEVYLLGIRKSGGFLLLKGAVDTIV